MTHRYIGASTVYGAGDNPTPYLTRAWVGKLRIHLFHRGDDDPEPHDHPWGFWTFPLRTYVEEVFDPKTGKKTENIVWAFQWHHRPAEYAHRVLHSYYLRSPHTGTKHYYGMITEGARMRWTQKILTVVWTDLSPREHQRDWGFWKTVGGHTCWQSFREFFGGGRHAPCSEDS